MIVSIEGLRKVYPGKQPVVAVDGIDLAVPKGEIFGLLGPNGAGKTTTISVATTRALPTSGRVTIAGVDVVRSPAQARRHVGVVTQYNTLDRACTVFENLYFHCRYFGFSGDQAKQRSHELLAQFLLTERAQSFPSQLSGGLAQRLQIARSIAHRPDVLFLDEPSAGLDPQSRIAMWDAVKSLHREGITVVLTTHYMEEADSLCSRLAIIDHGKILVTGTPEELKNGLGAQTIYEFDLRDPGGASKVAEALDGQPQIQSVEVVAGSATGLHAAATGSRVRILAQAADGLLPTIVSAASGYGMRDLRISEPTLETVFIRLTGRELRE